MRAGTREATADAASDAGPDALRFHHAPRPGRLSRFAAALGQIRRHPGLALAVVRARLTGRPLRARQSLAALLGIDHHLALPAHRLPEAEPDAAFTAAGIDLATPGTSPEPIAGHAPLVLLLAPGHAPVAGAAARIARAFADRPRLHALYGDALVVGRGGGLLPLLRPAFDADAQRGLDTIGPVVALRRASLGAIGTDLRPGAGALDAVLRLADRFGAEAVGHLPAVLSLWRPGPATDDVREHRAGRLRAVRDSLARTGEGRADAVLGVDGVIRIARPLPDPRPLVSLIVPTRDRLDLLAPCLASLRDRTDWPEKEILVCDNDSREPETLARFREWEAAGTVRVVACPGPFDFAAMNNRAAAQARGRVVVFVNNDCEAFRPDWLGLLVREALRPEIGAVGARLLDAEGRIQHAGVVLGTGGLVTHGHRHFPGDAVGYLGALRVTHAVSAVTAACLAVEATKFRAVGGFDASRFAVDFNDVDLCLRLDAAGYRTLLVPDAVLHHREAASRRRSPEASTRHAEEVARFKERWGPLLAQDPHYHPGFDPTLSTHARLRAGWTGREPAEPR